MFVEDKLEIDKWKSIFVASSNFINFVSLVNFEFMFNLSSDSIWSWDQVLDFKELCGRVVNVSASKSLASRMTYYWGQYWVVQCLGTLWSSSEKAILAIIQLVCGRSVGLPRYTWGLPHTVKSWKNSRKMTSTVGATLNPINPIFAEDQWASYHQCHQSWITTVALSGVSWAVGICLWYHHGDNMVPLKV